MTLDTPLCRRLGIRYPIVQAPVGSATTCPALVAAVSNAGGLGMLSVTGRDRETILWMLREIRTRTDRAFGVNLVLAWPMLDRLQACLEEGVRIVSLHWGDPSPYIPLVHAAGGLVLHAVGSAAEAREARPGEGDTVARSTEDAPIPRYSVSLPRPDMEGDVEAMALYAGLGVGLVQDLPPAGELVNRLVSEALRTLRTLPVPGQPPPPAAAP
jgi:NAD(P)H-dependent flavin oxidoreductase YrpB (nitropropane dioxygenase family)